MMRILLLFSLLVSAQAFADEPFRLRLVPSGDFAVEYQSNADSYFILERAEDAAGPYEAVVAQLGLDGQQTFIAPPDDAAASFFRVRQLDRDLPEDLDGDGIDDEYELQVGLNPLEASDAQSDRDGDGRSELAQYLALTALDVLDESGGPKLVVTQAAKQGVVIVPGMSDLAGRSVSANSPFVSMNDEGVLVFRGEWSAGGVSRRNIYAYHPETMQLRPLLNTSPDFELPYRDDNAAPSQDFSAAMVNNDGNVLVARRLNARVQVGFPLGDILTAPLTHLEAYSAFGNPTPGRRDLPVDCLVSGEIGIGPVAGILSWLNPVTAHLYPCPFNPASPWEAVHYRRSDGFPAWNNSGQAVFSALKGGNYLTTLLLPGASQSLSLLSGRNPHPKVSDTGLIMFVLDKPSGGTELILADYEDFGQRLTAADDSRGYRGIGFNAGLSDDGTMLVFLADYRGPPETGTPGPGLFAISSEAGLTPDTVAGLRPRRLSGVAGNGILEPGEEFQDADGDGVVDPGEDRGLIFGYPADARIEANNDGTVVFIGTDSGGRSALFAFGTTDRDEPRPGEAVAVATVGQVVAGHQVTGLELYDGLANGGGLAFWMGGPGKIATKTLVPLEIIPEVEAKVSADDGFTYLVLQIGAGEPAGQGTEIYEGAVAEWRIKDGAGGTLDQSETVFADGYTEARLTTSRRAGDRYVVEARLRAFGDGTPVPDAPWVKSAEVVVAPGAAKEIILEPSALDYPADGTSTIRFRATFKDQFGNLVEDGTSTRWTVTPAQIGSFLNAGGATTSGQAEAILVSPTSPGLQDVTVTADDASATVVVEAAALTGSVSGRLDLDLCADETSLIEARFNAADGTPVHWYTSNGSITERSFVQGGVARALLSAVGGRLGRVHVSATAGTRLVHVSGEFGCSRGLAIGAEHTVINGTQVEDGLLRVDFGNGRVRDIPYHARTPVNVAGPPNARVSITIQGVQAVAEWSLDAAQGDQTPDSLGVAPMRLTEAAIKGDDPHDGAGALELDGRGYGLVDDAPRFDFRRRFSASAWVRPDLHTEALLIGKGGAWQLRLRPDGRAEFEVSTETGTYRVLSPFPLPLELWSRVEARFEESRIALFINSNRFEEPSTGLLRTNDAPIEVGTGWIGAVDQVHIDGPSDTGQAVQVNGLDPGGILTLDAAGRGSFEIASLGTLVQDLPIEIEGRLEDQPATLMAIPADDAPPPQVARTHVVAAADIRPYAYAVDAFSGFVGGDTDTAAGFAAGIGGGLVGIADAGALAKNSTRIVYQAFGWETRDPNYLEMMFSGVGVITTFSSPTGIGAAADVAVSACRQIAAILGDTPAVRSMLASAISRVVNAVRRGDKHALVDSGRLLGDFASDPAVARAFSTFLHDGALQKVAERAFTELGPEFTKGVTRGVDAFGPLIGQRMVQAFDGLTDDAIRALKQVPPEQLREALDGLGRLAAQGINPNDVTRMLNNKSIFTASYERANLLRDFGLLAERNVVGLDLSVRLLKNRSIQTLGRRYEVEGAAYLVRQNKSVIELSRKVPLAGSRRIDTDIDVVVMEGDKLVYYQFKRSAAALQSKFNSGKKGLMGWIRKALAHLTKEMDGIAVDYSQIRIAIPPGVTIPARIEKALNALPGGVGALIERVPHG